MFKLFQKRADAPAGTGSAGGAASGPKVLRIDASMRADGSVTRGLADKLIDGLVAAGVDPQVTRRDLKAADVPFVSEEWIGANFTPADQRSDAQVAALARSDALVAELKASDVVVIASPIYNFSAPAALKAWIDMIARAGVTFRYTPEGPVGLLEGKRAVLLMASGGTKTESEIDFATPYLRHVLGFVGITEVETVAADGLMGDAESAGRAEAAVDALVGRLAAEIGSKAP